MLGWRRLCAGALLGLLAACSPGVETATVFQTPVSSSLPIVTQASATFDPTETLMPFTLKSPEFDEGGTIPSDFACTGANQSPELVWTEPPAGTQSFILIFNDPDAGSRGFVHWVIFNLPAASRRLAAGISPNAKFDDGTVQGMNNWGRLGYGGPCPPQGSTHNYSFTLYALDTIVNLNADASKDDLLAVMEGHVLAKAELGAKFGR